MIESIKNGDINIISLDWGFDKNKRIVSIRVLHKYKNVRLNETISLQCARLTYNFSHNSHNF